MNIPKEMVPKFERFLLDRRGLEMSKSLSEGELLRTMVKENLLIVREYSLRRTADSVEVFCSNKDLLKELETEFYEWLVEVGEITLEGGKKEE